MQMEAINAQSTQQRGALLSAIKIHMIVPLHNSKLISKVRL